VLDSTPGGPERGGGAAEVAPDGWGSGRHPASSPVAQTARPTEGIVAGEGGRVKSPEQGESGVPIVELCRQHQISEHLLPGSGSSGTWGRPEVRELRQLREENRKLKTLVADLTLDKTILREALGKKF
jgi:putative transposase